MAGRVERHLIEIPALASSAARVESHLIEVVVASPTFSPATPTGAGVTQHLAEAVLLAPGTVRIEQHSVEVIVLYDQEVGGPSTSQPTTTFGYAV
jgi:hypothetical protein